MTNTKITRVARERAKEDGFVPPGRFYFVNASFDLVFVHRAKRAQAQKWVDDAYGKGKYNIRLAKLMNKKAIK